MQPKLVRRGRNRWYVDLDRPLPGQTNKFQRIPGVTSIIREGLPKETLTRYAGTATAEYAVDNWDELAALPPTERLSRINKGRYGKRNAARDRGQQIHQMASKLVAGAEVPVPAELRGYVDAAVTFMDQFDVQEFASELTVFSETHYYCGTLDLGARVLIPNLPEYEWIDVDDDGRAAALCDYKTSQSGIWGDLAFQLAPYRWAEWALTADGEVIEMPHFDFGAGVHLRADGTYSVIPVECDEDVFEDFLTIKACAEAAGRSKELTLSEIVPPLEARYHLTKIDEGL